MRLQNIFESDSSRPGGAYAISLHMRCDGDQLKTECSKFNVDVIHTDGSYYKYSFFSDSFRKLNDLMDHLVNINFAAYSDRRRTFPAILKEEKIHYELEAPNISDADLKRLPSEIDCDLWLSGNLKVSSLRNFHKIVRRINGNFETFRGKYSGDGKISSNILSFLLIKDLKQIQISASFDDPILEAQKIINTYLPEGDLLECQEKLIEAGLQEFAKL